MRLRTIAVILAAATLVPGEAEAASPLVIDLKSNTDVVRLNAEDTLDSLGERAATCDLNRDGVPDLVLAADGASGDQNQRFRAGEVYVIYGRRRAWSGAVNVHDAIDVRIIGQNAYDRLGYGVACGDVDGDGWPDLVLGARYANSSTGKVHIVFGSANGLPPVIDLASYATPVINGAEPGAGAGGAPVVADVNGDGTMDIVIDSFKGSGRTGAQYAGRAYILFGRATWPDSIDLSTTHDVVIYGRGYKEQLSIDMSAVDLNHDDIADLLLTAPGDAGPSGNRPNSGAVFVLRGRQTWPAAIDLAVKAPDTIIYGADSSDQLGGLISVNACDVDGNGSPDIAVSALLGDGMNNALPDAGELRTIDMGGAFLSSVDLRTQTKAIIYGGAAGDNFGSGVVCADLNGDGTPDLAAGAWMASSPSTQWSGEIAVVYGREQFPAVTEIAKAQEDVIVYGWVETGEMYTIKTAVDINGDGVAEIIATDWVTNDFVANEAWIIGTVDTDGDGVMNLSDDCPLVYDPDQMDTIGDRRGDACRTDWDGDGVPDSEDCALADPKQGRPPEITGVSFSVGSNTTFRWQSQTTANTYDVSRGDLPRFDSSDFGSCVDARDPNLSDTSFTDTEWPVPSRGFFYLVRGRNGGCGGAGTWGYTSEGAERVLSNAQTCP